VLSDLVYDTSPRWLLLRWQLDDVAGSTTVHRNFNMYTIVIPNSVANVRVRSASSLVVT